MKVKVLGAVATAIGVALGGLALSVSDTTAAPASTGGAYGWPIAPFDQAHPVRAIVGDPRTLFSDTSRTRSLAGPGSFSFHDGIDIDARNGTRVYPVVSGVAELAASGEGVLVHADDGRLFRYEHITASVRDGQRVIARQTVLGRIRNWAEQLHFSELTRDGRVVNPLLSGHLTPYSDTTEPTVSRLHVRSSSGRDLDGFDLRGRVSLIAEAYDTPMPVDLSERRTLSLSKFARDRFPVTPAVVTWSLSSLGGRVVVPTTRVVDFRRVALRSNAVFWAVYARGTYQNRAVIGGRLHTYMPGRYLFKLTRSSLDTRRLANGVYVATVTAIDVSGNRSSRSQRLEIWNPENAR